MGRQGAKNGAKRPLPASPGAKSAIELESSSLGTPRID